MPDEENNKTEKHPAPTEPPVAEVAAAKVDEHGSGSSGQGADSALARLKDQEETRGKKTAP